MMFSSWYENYHTWDEGKKKALKTPVKSNKVKSKRNQAPRKKASLKHKNLGTKAKQSSKKKAAKRKPMARKRGKREENWSQNQYRLGVLLDEILSFLFIYFTVYILIENIL